MRTVADIVNKAWQESQASKTTEQDGAAPSVSMAYDRMSSIIGELHATLDFTEARLASICAPAAPATAKEAAGHYADGVQMAQMIHNQADRLFDALQRVQDLNRRIAL